MDYDRVLQFLKQQQEAKGKILSKKQIRELTKTHFQICEKCETKFCPKHGEVLCGKCRINMN